MQHQTVTDGPNGAQPSRAQIEPAALALLSRHSAGLLAFARRYSMTPQDAEDAYQRGVEILLTKAPTASEDELLPWLRTVVKHEAFAVRKSSGRALPAAEPVDGQTPAEAWTDERAERYERLRVGAEAMSALKPQEIRCLLLKAEGLSYNEICEATGFSYTKVNRCLTEGRRAFLKRVAKIESGGVCEMLAPIISKVADGEASPEEMREVRPHLKGCLACKATLREYRDTPTRLAGLVPPVALLAGADSAGASSVLGRIVHAVQDRLVAMGDVASAKLAVAGSALVLAGGGAAGMQAAHPDPPVVPAAAHAAKSPVSAGAAGDRPGSAPQPIRAPAASAATPAAAVTTPADRDEASVPARPAAESATTTSAEQPPEFDPGAAAPPAPATSPTVTSQSGEAASAGEFAP